MTFTTWRGISIMLKHLRGGMAKIFATFLLGLLIVSFVIFGTGPGILSSSSTHVAVVGDIKITPTALASAVQNRAVQLQQQANLNMDVQTLVRTFNLDYQILEQLITEATVAAHAKDLDLAASDEAVGEAIGNIEAFSLPGIGFSRAALLQTLRQNGISEAEFFEDIRRNLITRQLVSTLSATAPVPYFMAEELYRIEAERREATLMNFGLENVEIGDDPSDEVLAEFYQPQQENFRTPERRSYEYILITPDFYSNQVTLTQEDIQQAYQDRISEFVAPEIRNIVQVSTPDLATAQAIIAAVESGESFEQAATSRTNFTPDELTLGRRNKQQIALDLSEAAANAVFDLPLEKLSAPIENDFGGYNVFMVTDLEEGSEKTLDQVREQIEETARRERATDLMYDQLPEIEDAVFDGSSLEDVARRFGLNLARNTLIDRTGNNQNGEKVISQPEETRILAKAFTTEQGSEIERLDIDPNDANKGSYYVSVTEVIEPSLQDLANVKNQILALWREQESQRMAAELAERGRQMLESGLSADDIVSEIGGTSFKVNNLERVASDPSTSRIAPNIRRLIFDLPAGGIDLEKSTNGYVVAKVDAIRPGAPDLAISSVEKRLDAVSNEWLDEIFIQYQNYLAQRFPAEKNTVLVDQLFRNPPAQQGF